MENTGTPVREQVTAHNGKNASSPGRPLSAEQKAAYLAMAGCCPYCGSDQIEGQAFDAEGENVYQNVSCLDCEEEWYDIYTLTDVQEGVR